MSRFAAVGHCEAKEAVSTASRPPHHLADLSNVDVDEVWQQVSGRTRLVRDWCERLYTWLDHAPPWAQQRPSQLYQARQLEAEATQQRDEAANDRPEALAPATSTSVNWRQQPKLRIVGAGGEGKSWWAAHQLSETITKVREHVADGGDPDEVPLPIWIDRDDHKAITPPTRDGAPDLRQQPELVEHLVTTSIEKVVGARPDSKLVALLTRQVHEGRAHVVFDAAEHYPQFAAFVLSTWRVAGSGRLWVTTRPDEDISKVASPDLAEVRLRPLDPTATRRLLEKLTGTRPDPELTERLLGASTTGPAPLLISLASNLTASELPERPGAAPLLVAALDKLWRNMGGPDNGPVHAPSPVAQLLRWVGTALTKAIFAESEEVSHASRRARETSEPWAPPPRPVLSEGIFTVDSHELPAPLTEAARGQEVASECGIVGLERGDSTGEKVRVTLARTNDVIRDLATAYAIATDDTFAPSAVDDWGPWVRRLALVADTRMPTIAGFIGELLDPIDGRQEHTDRLDALLALLAQPTPLSELPDDDLRRIAPGYRPPP